MLPLRDNIPSARTPIVVTTLMVLCLIVYLIQLFAADGGEMLVRTFGVIPVRLFGTPALPLNPQHMPVGATLVTYALLHASWLHLLGNLLFLWIFADNVEDATGHLPFVVFFLLTSITAAIANAWIAPNSFAPIIGASGGVSGVLGAYLVLHPKAEISIAVPVLLAIRIVKLPAWIVLAAWFLFNFTLDQYLGSSAGIAFRGHIAGFIAGLLLIPFFAPRLRASLRAVFD